MSYLILDGANWSEWKPHHAGGLILPEHRRPSVLQPTREAGERECLRLSTVHPNGVFVLYAPVAVAKRLRETTHVNTRGEPLRYANVARLLPVLQQPDDSDDIPF